MTTEMKIPMLAYREHAAPPEAADRFAERRRIALLEPDPALRPVLIGILLRLGCVVSAKRDLAQVVEALQSDPLDGALIALEKDLSLLAAVAAANHRAVPVVVLSDVLPQPHLAAQFPGISFLQKPFDTREVLRSLHLPQRAVIVCGS